MTQVPPPPPGMPPAGMRPHRGTLILVFGIVGLVCCQIFSIVAWVMGNSDLREMRAGTMDPSGESLTTAGRICGIIGVILLIIGVVVSIIGLLVTGGLFWAALQQQPRPY